MESFVHATNSIRALQGSCGSIYTFRHAHGVDGYDMTANSCTYQLNEGVGISMIDCLHSRKQLIPRTVRDDNENNTANILGGGARKAYCSFIAMARVSSISNTHNIPHV